MNAPNSNLTTNRRGVRVGSLALLLAALGCGDSANEPAENVQERMDLLASVTDNVIVPAYERLATTTARMATATEALANAVGTDGEGVARAAAEEAFLEAYFAMQYAELLQVGPYGPETFEAGQNIRERVYSWPERPVNTCRVDQEVVEEGYEAPDFFQRSLVNVYGLDALEYLLMNPSDDNTCSRAVFINDPAQGRGLWADLDAVEIRARRARYAAAVAGRVATEASDLLQTWTSRFADELKRAGAGSATYPTSQAGLDALFAAIFYLELQVKDRKLAKPLGLSPDCEQATCPQYLESQYADASLTAVQANLQAFRDVYYGGPDSTDDRYGFGDLLRASNAGELADAMESALAVAMTRAPMVPEPMGGDVLTTEPPRALHAAIREVTTLLKTQFVSVLALRVPNEGAADND